MATFEIEGPDGQVFEITGDSEPTEAELDKILSGMRDAVGPKKESLMDFFLNRAGVSGDVANSFKKVASGAGVPAEELEQLGRGFLGAEDTSDTLSGKASFMAGKFGPSAVGAAALVNPALRAAPVGQGLARGAARMGARSLASGAGVAGGELLRGSARVAAGKAEPRAEIIRALEAGANAAILEPVIPGGAKALQFVRNRIPSTAQVLFDVPAKAVKRRFAKFNPATGRSDIFKGAQAGEESRSLDILESIQRKIPETMKALGQKVDLAITTAAKKTGETFDLRPIGKFVRDKLNEIAPKRLGKSTATIRKDIEDNVLSALDLKDASASELVAARRILDDGITFGQSQLPKTSKTGLTAQVEKLGLDAANKLRKLVNKLPGVGEANEAFSDGAKKASKFRQEFGLPSKPSATADIQVKQRMAGKLFSKSDEMQKRLLEFDETIGKGDDLVNQFFDNESAAAFGLDIPTGKGPPSSFGMKAALSLGLLTPTGMHTALSIGEAGVGPGGALAKGAIRTVGAQSLGERRRGQK